ncbi:hypothetical protein DDZ13_00375 [Coraliomargarita sinensis]|uniref:Uncharacterized protein n=1 Tax=Coraliomargarita sinensis TaxID=2174842 RepID=A0A317ZIC1_9BACT|nr:hypothetical protein [Coraliomargarita sinensis]PXA05355.1 hypothetical protein DDZ13_00375 [Coraliomargarita sinensis]
MAWCIADSIVKGEIDNRTRDRVTGKIWILGSDEPVELELTGNPHRDLAGQYLRFVNPKPKPLPESMQDGFAVEQTGVVGDMTAARKVKILDIPDGELEHYYRNKIPMPYHWGNCLYLEWHSARNGRVVIEATDYELTVEPEAAWRMSKDEEQSQHEANAHAMTDFMDTILEAATDGEARTSDEDDDAPQSQAEAEADAEAARMDLLNDRIQARLEKDPEANIDDYRRILEEERERLRRERNEPDPEPLSPEEEAARIEAMHDAMARTLAEEDDLDCETHPLVEQCEELAMTTSDEIELNEWLPENAHGEHPLHELMHGLWSAGAKLAGGLNGDPGDWPPEPLFAGDALVRLKKARGYLADAQAALQAVETEKLIDHPEWIGSLKKGLLAIHRETQGYIDELRDVLRDDDENELPF